MVKEIFDCIYVEKKIPTISHRDQAQVLQNSCCFTMLFSYDILFCKVWENTEVYVQVFLYQK